MTNINRLKVLTIPAVGSTFALWPLLGDKRPRAFRMIAKIADMAGHTSIVVLRAVPPQLVFVGQL